MKAKHCGGAAALLADGRVLASGSVPSESPSAAEIFDPSTLTWTAVSPMNAGRYNHVQVTIDPERILVAGGGGETPAVWKSAEIYHVSTGSWEQIDSMEMRRITPAASQLMDGRILVSGGYDEGRANSELLDLRTPTTLTASSFARSGAQFSAALRTTDGEPIAGRTVTFSMRGSEICSAQTDADGWSRCPVPTDKLRAFAVLLTQGRSYEATFSGDGMFVGATAEGSII